MPARDPGDRALLAKIAAAERWRRENPKDPNGPLPRARKAFMERFDREVDPDGVLDPAERARRAEHAKTAYFSRLALRSTRARRKAAELTADAEKAERELSELDGVA